MAFIFYLSSVIALLAAAMAISRRNAFHGLLYVVVSLLAVAVIFFSVGAAIAGLGLPCVFVQEGGYICDKLADNLTSVLNGFANHPT